MRKSVPLTIIVIMKHRSTSSGAAAFDLKTIAETTITIIPKAKTVRASSPSAVDRKWAATVGADDGVPDGGGLAICTGT
jgi:hypothetical protein